jgi:very-short-patch-repair endonuclease|tara:strand:- start:2657 stop:3445 length:789 start_codon:yes stop_codon:yes gene_type:complete
MSNQFLEKYKEYIIDQYVNQKKSTYEIAQDIGTYPNKIRRTLNTLGVDLRDRSSAQTVAIETGRHEHPTRGKKRTEAEKIAISNGMSNFWDNMEETERERRSKISKEQWASMSEEDKANLRRLAAEAVRKASKEGSKIEKFICEGLTGAGYDVIFHKKGLIPNENMEVDLFVPGIKTAIEIDGPAHFLPIWGEESLQKHIRADAQKAGMLINRGYVVLRVKNLIKNISQKRMRDILNQVIGELSKIENKFPPQSKRLIEIET